MEKPLAAKASKRAALGGMEFFWGGGCWRKSFFVVFGTFFKRFLEMFQWVFEGFSPSSWGRYLPNQRSNPSSNT